ncbi:MAG: transglutaminase domain-containing protein [Saprospiraceae bacterium]
MKKNFSALLFLFLVFVAQAQNEFALVDAHARSIQKSDHPTPEALSKALCKDLKNDRDKARALFTWIAENISYDFKALEREGPKADSRKEFDDKLVKQVYKKGRGVCMGYALLYKKMADAVGLECVFIEGNSKGSVFGGWESHAWNAVKIKGKWELLDVTWGAGYTDENEKFQQVFQPGFFFTLPRVFALNHFPEDDKWQLLDQPIGKNEFKKQSAFSYADPVKGITDTEPFGSPLAKGMDGKVELRLKMQQAPSVVQLIMGNRDLKFERFEKDGWLTLRFVPTNGRELQVWGGEKNRNRVTTTLIGVFPVE